MTGALPPLVGTAVKVTGVPAQTGPGGEAEIEIEGTAVAVILAAIIFEETVGGSGHAAEDVICTITEFPMFSDVVVKVAEFVPAGVPLTDH
jgi:hypothetical protein